MNKNTTKLVISCYKSKGLPQLKYSFAFITLYTMSLFATYVCFKSVIIMCVYYLLLTDRVYYFYYYFRDRRWEFEYCKVY